MLLQWSALLLGVVPETGLDHSAACPFQLVIHPFIRLCAVHVDDKEPLNTFAQMLS
jgi:hypothetical protein